MTRRSNSSRTWIRAGLLAFVLASAAAVAGKPTEDQPKEKLPGAITLQCDASTRCVGSASYEITASIKGPRGEKVKIVREGQWSCRSEHTVTDLPVGAAARIKVDWKTSKMGVTGSKTVNVEIHDNPKKNRITIKK